MYRDRIEIVINSLAKIISISDKQKKELIDKYSLMRDIDVIKELAQISYKMLKNNPELYDYALTTIRNINIQVCPTVEEMKSILNKMFINQIDGNMSLEENHQLINDSLSKFTKLFNEYGIDYYIVGALPCFIKLGEPLFRYHDDIDIMVNEKDIPKVREIFECNGYDFCDDRFPDIHRLREITETKIPHTVLAQNKKNEFHFGFFCFRREIDNSITLREYSHKIEDENVVVNITEHEFGTVGTNLRYDDIPIVYLDTSFRTSTVESVYLLKSYTKRPKDITDLNKLEPFINRERIFTLQNCSMTTTEIKNASYTDFGFKHK